MSRLKTVLVALPIAVLVAVVVPLPVLVMVVAAVAALPLAVLATARSRAPLVDLEVVDGALVVRPRGANQWWSLRRRLDVLVRDVVDIGVGRAADLPVGLRSPGTSVPGYRAGMYGTGEQRSFWLARRAEDVLVIELRDRPLRRIVVEVDDPEATAARLREQLRRAQH